MLAKEKDQLRATQKQIADLSESVKIAEERTQRAIEEKEKASEKTKETLMKAQILREELEDK